MYKVMCALISKLQQNMDTAVCCFLTNRPQGAVLSKLLLLNFAETVSYSRQLQMFFLHLHLSAIIQQLRECQERQEMGGERERKGGG